MGWVITSATNAYGATTTTYTLELPGFGLQASTAYTKTNSSQFLPVGTILNSVVRTSGPVETWGTDNGGLSAPGGIVVDVDSYNGDATVSGKKIRWKPAPVQNSLLRSSEFKQGGNYPQTGVYGFSQVVSVSTGAESWAASDNIYAYLKPDGITYYTKSTATANSFGLRRWIHGVALIADVAASGNCMVGLLWGSVGEGSFMNGKKYTPAIPCPAGFTLGQLSYTDIENTSLVASGKPVLCPPVIALNGSGAATVAAVGITSSDPSTIVPSNALPPNAGIRQSNDYDSGYFKWRWKQSRVYDAVNEVLDFNYLEVKIPAMLIFDPIYSRNLSPYTPDCAIDVTLPAPIGSCRIVWAIDSNPSGWVNISNSRPMVPFMCRRTDPTSPPYSGAVRNDFVKPLTTAVNTYVNFVPNTIGSTIGVYVSQDGVIPYALRSICSSFASGGGNTIDVAIGREAFPSTTTTVDIGPHAPPGSGGPSALEISWAYFDCSLATPGWTLVGSSSAMSIAYTTGSGARYWTGVLAVPTLPSDYPQGSLRIRHRKFVSGSWGAWQDGSVISSTVFDNVGMCSSIPLPVYPWNTQIPPWMETDADVTPVANAGWQDSIDRDHAPAITFSGSPTAIYSAGGLTIRHDAVTASASASKMVAAVSSLKDGMAKISDSSGTIVFDGQWRYFGKNLFNPSGSGAYVLGGVANPSSTVPTTCVVDHAVVASPPAGNYVAVYGLLGSSFSRLGGAVAKIYQTTFVIP